MTTTFDVNLSLVFRFCVVGPWGSEAKIEFDVGSDVSDVVYSARTELRSVYAWSRYNSLDDFLSDHSVRVSLHTNGRCYKSDVRLSEDEYQDTELFSGLLAGAMAGLTRDMIVHGTSREYSEVDYDAINEGNEY